MSKCILVVEDQEDNRQILRDLLGNAGYRTGRGAKAARKPLPWLPRSVPI